MALAIKAFQLGLGQQLTGGDERTGARRGIKKALEKTGLGFEFQALPELSEMTSNPVSALP